MKRYFSVLVLAGLTAAAYAQPTIDGTADGSYGAAIAVQDTQTGFGDSNLGLVDFANGSETDAGYAVVMNDTLYLVIAGNLESNFNKFELFFDTIAGGQNRLRGDNPDIDFDGLNRMGDDGTGNGLTFDAGFEADYFITVTGGDTGDGFYHLFSNYAELLTEGGGVGRFLGEGGAVTDGTLNGGDNPDGILITINNSNVAGVTGGNGTDTGEGVTTGVELAIPLAAIGNPTGAIKISAFVNGLSHDFLANQVLGGIGGGDNLGEPRVVDFNSVPGDQFFAVGGGGGDCNGNEVIKKAVCKTKNGKVKKVVVKMKKGTAGVEYTATLNTGEIVTATANDKGKATFKFKRDNAPPCGDNGVTICGATAILDCAC